MVEYETVGWIRPTSNENVLRVVYENKGIGIVHKDSFQKLLNGQIKATPIRTSKEEKEVEKTRTEAGKEYAENTLQDKKIKQLEDAIYAFRGELNHLKEQFAKFVTKEIMGE